MANRVTSAVLRDVDRLFNREALAGLSDQQLLERFARRADEAAFAGLVARHGPMVLGVCRRALDDPNDVNDAFQATFLVLVRKAAAVRVEGSLGRWLYGVSRRVSARARAAVTARSAREVSGVESLAATALDPARRELGFILDEEIGRLPERFQTVTMLCDLQGLSHDEAAERLGCAVGTVKSRLSRAREKLRGRLMRRGFVPSAVAVCLALPDHAATAAVPASLVGATVGAAMRAGVVSAAVNELAQGALKAMVLTRWWPAVGTIMAISVFVSGAVVLARQGAGDGRPGERGSNGPGVAPPVARIADDPPATVVTESVILRPFVDRAWYALFSPDGKSLVTGTNTTGAIRIYDVATRKAVGSLDGEAKTSFACAAFSPDGKLLATSGAYRILVWDFATRNPLIRFMAHLKGVRALAFSPDGKTLVSASEDKTVKRWDVDTWQTRPDELSAREPVFCATFSPDGKALAIATGDTRTRRPPRVMLYDDGAGPLKERLRMTAGERGPAWTVAFSPDGKALASSSSDPAVKLWDTSSGRELRSLPLTDRSGSRGLAFTPDGRALAAGLGDGSIAVWDTRSGRQLLTLRGHSEHIFTVAISPDGKTLASAGRDGTVRLWDLAKNLP